METIFPDCQVPKGFPLFLRGRRDDFGNFSWFSTWPPLSIPLQMGLLILRSILLLMALHDISRVVGNQMLPWVCQLVKNQNKLVLPPSFLFQKKKPIDVSSTEKTLKVGALP